MLRKLAGVRGQIRESFGNIAMSMMVLPGYRHQSLADLQHLVLEPLIRDRIAMAWPAKREEDPSKTRTGKPKQQTPRIGALGGTTNSITRGKLLNPILEPNSCRLRCCRLWSNRTPCISFLPTGWRKHCVNHNSSLAGV